MNVKETVGLITEIVLIKLLVNGKPKFETFGYKGILPNYVSWKGTLRNTEFKTDSLSMKNLPDTISSTKSLIVQCANSQYQEKSIQINKYINGQLQAA